MGCHLGRVQGFLCVCTKKELFYLVVSLTWKLKVSSFLYVIGFSIDTHHICFFNISGIKINILFVDSFDVFYIAGDVLLSMFLNELYGFQLDTQRWYVVFVHVSVISFNLLYELIEKALGKKRMMTKALQECGGMLLFSSCINAYIFKISGILWSYGRINHLR